MAQSIGMTFDREGYNSHLAPTMLYLPLLFAFLRQEKVQGDSFYPSQTNCPPWLGRKRIHVSFTLGGEENVEVFLNSIKSIYQAALIVSVLKMVIKFCCIFHA